MNKATLKLIRTLPAQNADENVLKNWFLVISSCWVEIEKNTLFFQHHHVDESHDTDLMRYYLTIGEHPENEVILEAMKANKELWDASWEMSNRAGNHIFSFRVQPQDK
jgi:hypothetical protein